MAGMKYGVGTLSASNGERYEGGFKDDEFYGPGMLILPDGVFYKGNWSQGMFNGKGRL